MKKILALLLAVMMVVSMAACNNNNATTPNTDNTTNNTDATDTTNPIVDAPKLSEQEDKMLNAVGSLELPYPVMTWAINVKNQEQVTYYMDTHLDNVLAIAITETAYEYDESFAEYVLSVMYVQVDSIDKADSVAQRITNALKIERWPGQSRDTVDIAYEIVDDYIVIIVLGKDNQTYSMDALMSVFKAAVTGDEVFVEPDNAIGSDNDNDETTSATDETQTNNHTDDTADGTDVDATETSTASIN